MARPYRLTSPSPSSEEGRPGAAAETKKQKKFFEMKKMSYVCGA